MLQNQYRIDDFFLLELVDTQELTNFGIIDGVNSGNQYVLEKDIEHTVIESTNTLNKIYRTSPKITFDSLQTEELPVQIVNLYIRQNFVWDPMTNFRIHLKIKDTTSNDMLLSRVFTLNELKIIDYFIIDGNFWQSLIQFKIPKLKNHNISAKVEIINYDDIEYDNSDLEASNNGLLYTNKDDNYIPIINKQPLPDFIDMSVTLDKNMFLSFGIITVENKSVEQSLMDYFNESHESQVTINYQIDYGNEEHGYRSMIVSNNVNKYSGLKLMIDYPDSQEISIIVTMNVKVDEKLMQRQITLSGIDTSFVTKLTEFDRIQFEHIVIDYSQNETYEGTVIQSEPTPEIIVQEKFIYVREIMSDKEINISVPNTLISFNLPDDYDTLILLNKDKSVNQVLKPRTDKNYAYFDLNDIQDKSSCAFYNLLNSQGKIISQGPIVK